MHERAIAVILGVHVVSLLLTFLAFAAWRRSGDKRLGIVALAFLTFAVKSLLTAYALWSNLLIHETLEEVGALFDFIIVILLVTPFLVRRNARTQS